MFFWIFHIFKFCNSDYFLDLKGVKMDQNVFFMVTSIGHLVESVSNDDWHASNKKATILAQYIRVLFDNFNQNNTIFKGEVGNIISCYR